jgi:hypothetical protein
MVQKDWKGEQTRHHQRNLQVNEESFRKFGVDETIGSFLLQQRKHHSMKDLLSEEETRCKTDPQRKENMPCALLQLTTMFHETGGKNIHENCVEWLGFGKDVSEGFFHRGQGYPLEGPFLAHFSQGISSKMNEIVHFSGFRIFCGANLALRDLFQLVLLGGGSQDGSLPRKCIGTLSITSWKMEEPGSSRKKERGTHQGTPHPSMNHFHKSDRRLEGEKD